MLQSVPYKRVFTQVLSGTPTALAIPSDISPVEIWIQNAATVNIRELASDPGFALATGSIHRIPTDGPLLVDGSGTASIIVFGIPNIAPVKN